MKRQKLDYEEMTPCLKQVTRVWDEMLCTPEGVKINMDVIQDAVREGKFKVVVVYVVTTSLNLHVHGGAL